MSKPFKRSDVKPGDIICSAEDESVLYIFRDICHQSTVLARRVEITPDLPWDVLGRQKEFRIPD